MNRSSFTRSRRTGVDYGTTPKSANIEVGKFNSLGNKDNSSRKKMTSKLIEKTIETKVYKQQIDMEAETDTRSSEIQKKPGYSKYAEKSVIGKKSNEEEDNKSIASYNSEDDYQSTWKKIL
ncbi:1805_t:CDS:2, partial [Diversispora eburnea]